MAEIDTRKVLFEALKQTPIIALLALALYGSYSGLWVWKSVYEETKRNDAEALKQCTDRASAYADIALRGTRLVQEQANEELTKSEAKPIPSNKIAAKSSPAVPAKVATEVKAPLTSSDPAALNRKIEASKTVIDTTKKP